MESKKYGFDFDGVIHKSVGIPDIKGQRDSNVAHLYEEKNDAIIDKVFDYLKLGYTIEIISSRLKQDEIMPVLLEFIRTKSGYKDDMITNQVKINTGAAGDKKTNFVIDSGVIEFYDDSVNVLIDIMLELRKRGNTTMKLFLVRPELNDFIEVNSIAQLMNELIKLNIRLLCNKSIKNQIDKDYIKLKEQINILINGNQKRVINIYGTVFVKGISDFAVLKENNMENNLFIYNESFKNFKNKDMISAESGNSIVRPYRQDNKNNFSKLEPKIKSLGIPTGGYEDKDKNNYSLDIVKESIENIFNFIINHNNINNIYYSALKTTMGLAGDIFLRDDYIRRYGTWAKDNLPTIGDELKAMFKKLRDEKNYEIHLFLLEGTTLIEYNLDTMKPI